MAAKTKKPQATRIYTVTAIAVAAQTYLVEAGSQSQARNHVAGKFITGVAVASPKHVGEVYASGGKIETAREDQQTGEIFPIERRANIESPRTDGQRSTDPKTEPAEI